MKLFAYLCLGLFLSSCTVNYSFTGSALPPETKTVFVGYFRNIAPLVNPRLSDQFTEALKDKLASETRLRLTNGTADLQFEGEITNYEQSYLGVTAQETASQNKLTITIKVRYTNNKEPLKSFEKDFSSSANFDATKSINQIEDILVKQITDDILNQIFKATVNDW